MKVLLIFAQEYNCIHRTNNRSKIKNTRGMVAQDRAWEISAIPAAVEVSFPYALGMTTVLRPSGIAREATAHIKKVLSKSKSIKIPINTMGMINRRIIDTM